MDISLSSEPLDIAFHPSSSKNLLATGLISGKVQLYDFKRASETTTALIRGPRSISPETDDDSENGGVNAFSGLKGKDRLYDRSWSVRPSHKSCRGVAFSTVGDDLYTLAKDGSLFRLNTETGSVVSKWDKAHSSAPSRILPINQNLFATGDDDGVISLWDPRRPTNSNSAIRTYEHHFDWITSMLWCSHLAPPKVAKLSKEEEEKKQLREEKKRKRKEKKSKVNNEDEEDEGEANSAQMQRERLVVTSGDGTLSVIDLRAGKKGVEVSEDQEDELLSIASVKQNSKLVVGTQLGILSLWAPTKGLLDHVDRIPGHPASVDTMCTLDDDTILTGSSDGLVRVVQILPHKLLGIVADHGGMPVERIARSENWMASIGHGAEIKLTDLAPLLEEDEDDEDEGGELQTLGVTKLSSIGTDDSSDEEDEEDEPDNEGGEEGEEMLGAKSIAEDENSKDEEIADSSEEETEQPSSKKAKKIASILRPPTLTEEGAAAVDFFADL